MPVIFVPYLLKVCGTLPFLLLEHFMEHGKLISVLRVPNVRGC
ncbi:MULTISPECIES: hypothetical protein [Poseidonibacter]|nr:MULTISPECIES: hypothetical protein [Poseidonibacter]